MAQACFLCTLSIEQLNAVSTRINEMCETARNPDYRADLQDARRAIQDLATNPAPSNGGSSRNKPGHNTEQLAWRRQSPVPGGGLMDCGAQRARSSK
jgi:hypothetical protein